MFSNLGNLSCSAHKVHLRPSNFFHMKLIETCFFTQMINVFTERTEIDIEDNLNRNFKYISLIYENRLSTHFGEDKAIFVNKIK